MSVQILFGWWVVLLNIRFWLTYCSTEITFDLLCVPPSHRARNHCDAKWSWWRHQMETFSALLAICAGNSPVPGEFPTQRPVTRSFDVYFDLRPNKRFSKQSWGWWFVTLSCSLWRHLNVIMQHTIRGSLQEWLLSAKYTGTYTSEHAYFKHYLNWVMSVRDWKY